MEPKQCKKCGENTHVIFNCTLRIRIPHHVKISWECPNCSEYFESVTPSLNHEYYCTVNPSVSSAGRIYSHPPKRLNTPLELPKIYLLSRK